MERFVASFKYGPNLSLVEITKETAKTVKIGKSENLIGWQYFGTVTKKDKIHLFEDKLPALEWLHEEALKDKDRVWKDLKEAEDTIASLEAEISALNEISLQEIKGETFAGPVIPREGQVQSIDYTTEEKEDG